MEGVGFVAEKVIRQHYYVFSLPYLISYIKNFGKRDMVVLVHQIRDKMAI